MNKVLCAGCSHTREFYWDPWPSYINNSVNIGIRGAGPDLISKRVVVELAKNEDHKWDSEKRLWYKQY